MPITPETLFADYFKQWIHDYKEGSVRPITLNRYYLTLRELQDRCPELRLVDLNHYTYQKLINNYAETHEYLTVKCFHHHCKAAIMDAMDDDYVLKDPTKHLVLRGKKPKPKKPKYLGLLDLKRLLNQLDLSTDLGTDSSDWLILLISKTGMRFAEALGLTPADIDFEKHTLSINKTWDYKSTQGHFQPTKNTASMRTIAIDPIISEQLHEKVQGLPATQPMFIPEGQRVYLSTVNYRLAKHCKAAGVPLISAHGLRHTHASLLIYDGVSISSVAKRLGHSNTITTQKTYLHIVKELETRDNQIILNNMIRLS